MSMASGREPMAFAKLVTRRDVIQPFYITDEHVKAIDEIGNPTDIQVVLGRSSPQRLPITPAPPFCAIAAPAPGALGVGKSGEDWSGPQSGVPFRNISAATAPTCFPLRPAPGEGVALSYKL
jgi:hypothetical protein